MNLINDVVTKNQKTYLTVRTVDVEVHTEHLSIQLQSNELSPVIVGLVNKAVNTHWRDYYEKMLSQIEAFSRKIFQSIMPPVLEKMAVEDFYQPC